MGACRRPRQVHGLVCGWNVPTEEHDDLPWAQQCASFAGRAVGPVPCPTVRTTAPDVTSVPHVAASTRHQSRHVVVVVGLRPPHLLLGGRRWAQVHAGVHQQVQLGGSTSLGGSMTQCCSCLLHSVPISNHPMHRNSCGFPIERLSHRCRHESVASDVSAAVPRAACIAVWGKAIEKCLVPSIAGARTATARPCVCRR